MLPLRQQQRPDGWNFPHIIDGKATAYAACDAHILPLVYEQEKRNIRLVSYDDGQHITAVDEAYFTIIKPLAFSKITTIGRFSGVYFGSNDWCIEAVIMPIRIDKKQPSDFFPRYETLTARSA